MLLLALKLVVTETLGQGGSAHRGEVHRQLSWLMSTHVCTNTATTMVPIEVDLLLETGDGRVAGLEVRATSSVRARDVRWLTQLCDSRGPWFVGGIVLHTGATAVPLGDRIAAVPLDVL